MWVRAEDLEEADDVVAKLERDTEDAARAVLFVAHEVGSREAVAKVVERHGFASFEGCHAAAEIVDRV